MLEINIGRGQAEEYCAGLFTDKWLDKGDEDDSIRKKLDWNTLRIVARGGHITVDLIELSPPPRDAGIGTVAVHSDADASAMHVRAADHSERIGPPGSIGSTRTRRSASPSGLRSATCSSSLSA